MYSSFEIEAVAIYKKDLCLPLMMSSKMSLRSIRSVSLIKVRQESQVYDYLEMLVPEEWEDFISHSAISIYLVLFQPVAYRSLV